jgi:pimeloyl-ACP methyl ester carboxylesterase
MLSAMSGPVSITLRGGRTLGYREYGDPGGTPVVNCHGGTLCGLDVAAWSEDARALGMRLVSPDRPGLGESTAVPGRTTADWADDVEDLADALGLDRFGVLGWSMGGQYALACAARLGARVTKTVVLAGALPLDNDATFLELNEMDKRFTNMALRKPRSARLTLAALGALARHAPKMWCRGAAKDAEPEEAAMLTGPTGRVIAEAAAVALRGGEGMAEEYRAWVRPWGFALDAVTTPVVYWQGDRDALVPPHWADELARRTPGSTLHTVEGAGHFFGYTHTKDVLSEFT